MGRGHIFPFSNVGRGDESTSLFEQRPPLSAGAGSSPSPLLLGGKAEKSTSPATARRHVAVRFICAPFAAVLIRMKWKCCARAGTASGDTLLSNNNNDLAATMERGGEGRRPSLVELLRMEGTSISSPSSCLEYKSPQDTVSCGSPKLEHGIVVFGVTGKAPISCTVKEDPELQEPLSQSKFHGAIVTVDETAIVAPAVKVDVGAKKVVPGGGTTATTASPDVPIPASPSPRRRRALLQALTLRMTKGRYWRKLAGPGRRSCGGAGSHKAELFYQRPIPLGRRCRVQHLEDSPYYVS